jgi:hypothetical protein
VVFSFRMYAWSVHVKLHLEFLHVPDRLILLTLP